MARRQGKRHRPDPSRTSHTRLITRIFWYSLYGQSYKEDMVCERGRVAERESSREREKGGSLECDGMGLGFGVDLRRAP